MALRKRIKQVVRGLFSVAEHSSTRFSTGRLTQLACLTDCLLSTGTLVLPAALCAECANVILILADDHAYRDFDFMGNS